MENLDLNIDNYSIRDIENFFKLNTIINYSLNNINENEAKIKEKIFNTNINNSVKNELNEFISKAKQILIIAKFPNNNLIDNNSNLTNINLSNSIINAQAKDKNVIVHPETQYIYSNPSEFFPGKINPLNTRITSTYIVIDSRFRDNYETTSSSDFTIYLPTRLTKVVSMQVTSFEIPICFYGISESYGNNYFSITIYYLKNGEEKKVTREFIVPDGNYNPTTFISVLNNLISPKDEDGNLLYPLDMFSYLNVSLDLQEDSSGTGKVTFGVTGEKASDIICFTLDFSKPIKNTTCFETNPISSRIGSNLGFIREKYTKQISYTGETIIEPATIRYIYLAIDDYNNNVNSYFIPAYKNATTFTSSIIAKISIKNTFFGLLMENDLNIVTEPRKYFGPVDIQKLRITLLDDHGRILEMSGNYSFCLIFKQLYDL